VRCTPLSAGWRRDPRDDQRDRGETLHENILRLFGIVGWLVGVGDKAVTKTVGERGAVRKIGDIPSVSSPFHPISALRRIPARLPVKVDGMTDL